MKKHKGSTPEQMWDKLRREAIGTHAELMETSHNEAIRHKAAESILSRTDPPRTKQEHSGDMVATLQVIDFAGMEPDIKPPGSNGKKRGNGKKVGV